MPTPHLTRDVLLRRAGLIFLEPRGEPASESQVRAVELELAALGYVLSTRLRAKLARISVDDLGAFSKWACGVLAAKVGADQKHVPLFARFPDGIPEDTEELWWRKVLVHFFQGEGQPCLFCRNVGTTHVLYPCRHVVCDRCFDGASYTACPVCEHHVNRSSPFFRDSPRLRAAPNKRVIFQLLDLGEHIDAAARALFVSFCERRQALSPTDREDLGALVLDHGERALAWLPDEIPLKENIALIFGGILRHADPKAVLPRVRPHLATATDVLRLIAAYSDADPSLQAETRVVTATRDEARGRWWGKAKAKLERAPQASISVRAHRFDVSPIGRPLRKALFAILEGFDGEKLIEDMLRHRSLWVWVGEFLHPHEYASRFPKVARAFAVLRKKAPDGTKAPAFKTWYGKLEAAIAAGDATATADILRGRPGELARRLDLALRLAGDDPAALAHVSATFEGAVPSCSTPVLLTLWSLLPTRARPLETRIFFPKGMATTGVSIPDARPPLPADAIAPARRAAEAELLRRFAEKPPFDDAILDASLKGIVVPFNERTASRSAVALPRGSRLDLPPGKLARLFLHWCQPEEGGRSTDIDLSVGFYDAAWKYVGVCSYYRLNLVDGAGRAIATSAGDLRDAPFPDGATELVDVDRALALARGIRYAVMVVNNYRGMSFSKLERGFAGLMLRDDAGGAHFDPRAVALKFELQGENGIFLPLVFDVREGALHWLDLQSKGKRAFNNADSSNEVISKICPEMMGYFAAGVRPSMFDLARFHAAARARRVFVRGEGDGGGARVFRRREGESPAAFLARLTGTPGEPAELPRAGDLGATFAALLRGDVELPERRTCYALFREGITDPIAAADLLS